MSEQRALTFACAGNWLYGVAHVPAVPHKRGVLVVVGGPQYRAGSHRQFTLLARSLAGAGVACMRFDYRGMGDSEGAMRDFEDVGEDLRAAIDTFFQQVPQLEEVVLWGLCDAASAAMLYARNDARVGALVLLNPWVRTDAGAAKATIKHYYRGRLLEGAFWKKIVSGRFNVRAAAASLFRLVGAAAAKPASGALPDRMHAAMAEFKGKSLVILSGADLTAREFEDLAGASDKWQQLMQPPRVTRHALPKADHTFSRAEWSEQVARWTADWVQSF
ncbi:hydrolase 1, exosortase A system-associated [Massilia sp. CF038]|uniref:hydrolase 1, exosortase A system-associated n=1 Tax=Massilia sp. CF038 TaxID=1881045 RepID=UPI00091C2DDA|nr:hydrolase 1, exosortase A system-associated [Massilia sp. CF038]SHH41833.1 exosortase A system-associated hydrolase 1 [Massilia sp. CF038]